MNDTVFDTLYLVLLLILPISALAARRLPITQTLKMALAWAAVFAAMFLLVSLWQGAFGGASHPGATTQ